MDSVAVVWAMIRAIVNTTIFGCAVFLLMVTSFCLMLGLELLNALLESDQ